MHQVGRFTTAVKKVAERDTQTSFVRSARGRLREGLLHTEHKSNSILSIRSRFQDTINCCSLGDECYRKSRECEGLQNVLMDAIRKRTGMCCIQWKDDEFVNRMPRTSYQSGIDETADKSSQEEIQTVL